MAEQGAALPIVYGTAKLPILLLERHAPIHGFGVRVKELSDYDAGQRVVVRWDVTSGAGTSSYDVTLEVAVGGTTGGTSSANDLGLPITDIELAPAVPWQSFHTQAVGEQVISNGYKYVCITPGVTGGTAPNSPTSLNITDGTVHWARGQYVSGSCSFDFIGVGLVEVITQAFVAALCEGEVAGGGRSLWWDKERIVKGSDSNFPGKQLTISTGPDALTQTVPAEFDQCGYQHTAIVHGTAASSGSQTEMPAIALELRGVLFGGGGPDANPADVLNDLLTHARRGAGWSAGWVDASITGTAASGYRVYCDAFGFRLTWVIDSQRTALSLIGDLLTATNSDAVWSGGKLKVVPLGDVASTSPVYGATNYSPSVTAVYNLGADDLLGPVEVERRPEADSFNSIPVEFKNRSADYAAETVEDPDVADLDLRGAIARGGTLATPFIFADGQPAIRLSRILAQRSANPQCRNTYRFRLPWRFVLLEPTDVVTLTDSLLGLAQTPVRITELSEESDGTLSLIAEDYPAGVAAAAAYTPQLGDGLRVSDRGTLGYLPREPVGTAQVVITIQDGDHNTKTATLPEVPAGFVWVLTAALITDSHMDSIAPPPDFYAAITIISHSIATGTLTINIQGNLDTGGYTDFVEYTCTLSLLPA